MNQHVFSICTKHFTVDVNLRNTQLLPRGHPQLYLTPDLEQTQRKPPESHTPHTDNPHTVDYLHSTEL